MRNLIALPLIVLALPFLIAAASLFALAGWIVE